MNVLYIDRVECIFTIMTYMATPLHKNPSPGGHEIYNFGRPFLNIITLYLVYLIFAWEKRRF